MHLYFGCLFSLFQRNCPVRAPAAAPARAKASQQDSGPVSFCCDAHSCQPWRCCLPKAKGRMLLEPTIHPEPGTLSP